MKVSKAKSSKKQDEGAKKKAERKSAADGLAPLVGKSVRKMTKAEQESLLIVMGQLAGLLDENDKVKPLA